MGKLGFSRGEIKSIAGLASVIASRMLGLSLIIPVFSVYATGLPGSTAFLAGLAFGIYGLTQAVLQIPFGYMSDRFGRKPVVAFGLAIFGLGSVMAAMTDNIYVLIAARFLQGAGAIASACIAWLADLTEPSRRNMAMAFAGISIGGSIVLGMILGPIIGGIIGVAPLFWVAAVLSVIAIFVTLGVLKEPEANHRTTTADSGLSFAKIKRVAITPDLLKLDIAGFVLNACMIATFFSVPLKLSESFAMSELWKVYLPLSIAGGFVMMMSSRKADKGSARKVLTGAFFLMFVAFVVLAFSNGLPSLLGGFSLFFVGLCVLEASMPAAVTTLADPANRGSVVGVYNLSQFMGTFLGGMFAGWLAQTEPAIVFGVMAAGALMAAWLMNGAMGIVENEPEPAKA
ncbi:Inner membrane transport protein YajR [hydrothermal vent metagenome]|uniref:Inner membrane transport protein YajR n=1 Tax=hydrothermal vent metagenome TaxID=652676 RepID=A0A3B1BGU8_9ZZZZ